MTEEERRLVDAIEATKSLPKGWLIELLLNKEKQDAFVCDPWGGVTNVESETETSLISWQGRPLYEQIERCIKYINKHKEEVPF
jgi:hypothetical protein